MRRFAISWIFLCAARATPAQSDSATVRAMWNAYLESRHGAYSSNAGVPSPYWLEREQRKWQTYDFAQYYLGDGATAESIAVDREQLPDSLGGPGFRIRTRFRVGDGKAWTTTVYALRDGRQQWRLANALTVNTRTWHRATVGPITYVFPPDYSFRADRARRAVGFTDSVSAALRVPPLAPTTYYLAPTLDEAYRIVGLETGETYDSAGGFSQPVNHLLFSGIPSLGEDYRHELAHLLLAPLCCERTMYLVSEGVPTWLGGTSGADYKGSVSKLRQYLLSHPAVTLDSVLDGRLRTSESYPAAAVVVAMVAEHAGPSGVRNLFSAGTTTKELRSYLERVLGKSWIEINAKWRDVILKS